MSLSRGCVAAVAAIVATGCTGGRSVDGGSEARLTVDAFTTDSADAEAEAGDARDEEPNEASTVPPGPWTGIIHQGGLSPDRACDLDGDGTLDNAVADLGAQSATLFVAALNSYLSGTISEGTMYGLHMPWVADLASPDDPEVTLIGYLGVDLDTPPDPSDNFSGEEPHAISWRSLDGCGEPLHAFETGRLEEGRLEAANGSFPFPFSATAVGYGARVWGTVAPGGATSSFESCLYADPKNLGESESPASAGDRSLLEALVAGGALVGLPTVSGLSPDLDLDGDGLERYIVDAESHIESCIDGDSTVIAGPDCWRDDRMADGFAFTLTGSTVSGRPVGRQRGWEDRVEGECPDGPPEESLLDPR